MDKEQLKKLREKLPVGWARILARKTGKSRVMIYKVIAGDVNDKDDTIITEAIKLAERTIKKQNLRIAKIKSL